MGFKAYVHVLEPLLPDYRRQIKIDSPSMAHLKVFTKVLKLAMNVDADAFSKAYVSKNSGVAQTPVAKHATLVHKLRQAIHTCMGVTAEMSEEKQLQVSLTARFLLNHITSAGA